MIKGKSKIELTNVKTGEVKTYENENMITDLVDVLPSAMNFYSAFSKFSYPIYKSVFSGILLFNNLLTEDKTKMFPDGNCQPFASAGNIVNSGTRTDLGSYNTTESGVQSDGSIKMVWDFGTSQGNGTIKALGLTSGDGGICGYGSSVNTTTDYVNTVLSEEIINWYNIKNANDRQLLVDYDENKMYLWYYVQGKVSSISIREYDIALKSLKLSSPGLINNTYKNNVIQLSTDLQNLYMYFGNTCSNGKTYFIFANNNYIIANSKFYLLEIDMFNNYSSKTYEITNTTGEKVYLSPNSSSFSKYLYVSKNGYVYLQGDTTKKMFKIKLTDSTDIIEIGTYSDRQYFHYEISDYLYFNYYNSPLKILNEIDNSVRYMNSCSTNSFNKLSNQTFYSWVAPILIDKKETPFFMDILSGNNSTTYAISFLNNYLATINNLASDIIKTADNTMKITYTLTELKS